MAHAHGGSHGGVRLHRVFLQSAPAPLGAPLSQSSTVRKENPQPDHRGLTVTCPRKRGNSSQRRHAHIDNGAVAANQTSVETKCGRLIGIGAQSPASPCPTDLYGASAMLRPRPPSVPLLGQLRCKRRSAYLFGEITIRPFRRRP